MTITDTFFNEMSAPKRSVGVLEEVQERLQSLFGGCEVSGLDTPAGSCLGPLLAAMEWAGHTRHLQEALPHFNDVKTANDLRSVLARLNYASLPRRSCLAALSAEMLPCLFEAENGKLYVVVARESGSLFLVFDSAAAEFRSVEAKELDFGTAYLIQPTDFAANRKYVERHGWLSSVIGKFKRTFASLFLLTFAINCLALVVPLYVMTVYDKAVGSKSVMTLGYLLVGVILAICVDIFLRNVRARYLAYLGSRVEALVTTTAFEKLLHLPIGMTENSPIGSQVTRIKQFEAVREIFSGPLATTVLDFPFFMVFLATIFVIGGSLGWVPVALMAVYMLMAIATVPLMRMRVRQAGDAKSENRNFLMELVSKRDAIRDAGAEDVWVERFRGIAGQTIVTQFSAQKLSMVIQTAAQALVVIAGAATVGIGTVFAMNGDLSAGALIAVMTLVWRVLSPLQAAFLSLNRIGQTRESFEQINALMRLISERRPGGLPTFFREFSGRVTMKRVAFRYSPKTEPALRGVDLDIQAGEFVAVTGPSGSGKTSLLKVMQRLYQPQAGVVLLDRHDLRQLDVSEIRHSVGFVPDRPVFFYGTVMQNLKLANPAATREDMWEALDIVGAREGVEALSHGLDTRMCANSSDEFSHGLLQQILLAQAVVKKPPIFLMDEPGNNLDHAGDEALMKMFERLRKQATLVIVTHRPSHMKMTDRVVVLDNGLVAGEGPPEKVLPALAKMQQERVLANS